MRAEFQCLIVELDGFGSHRTLSSPRASPRQRHLEDLRYTVICFAWVEASAEPARVISEIRRRLAG